MMFKDWTRISRVRLESIVTKAREVSASRRVRTIGLAIILPLFVIALVLAWRNSNLSLGDLAVAPTLVVAGIVPIGILASLWQLRAMVHLGGGSVTWWSASRVTTLGSLSGLLPGSSTTVVRGGALVYWGLSPRQAGQVIGFDFLIWTCISVLFSGTAALFLGALELAFLMFVGGALLVPLSVATGKWFERAEEKSSLVAARILGLLALTFQLQACFWVVGENISFAQAGALAVAAPLASLVFFLPGALGVQEFFIAAVASAVDLSTSLAFLAAVFGRLIGFSVLALWEGTLLISGIATKSHPTS